jgi:hypothetical protein
MTSITTAFISQRVSVASQINLVFSNQFEGAKLMRHAQLVIGPAGSGKST